MADFFGGKLTPSSKKDSYFDQTRKREAEFINMPNGLKDKVGTGGLDQDILQKAQALIDNNSIDFTSTAQRYLTALREGVRLTQTQRHRFETDGLLATIAQPAMQLKANGAMFGFPLVTQIADLLIHFIEVIDQIDDESIDVMRGFSTALNAVIVGNIRGDGGDKGKDLYQALEDACQRYFNKNNIDLHSK